MLKGCKSVVDEAAVRDNCNFCLWPAAQMTMTEGHLLSTQGEKGLHSMGHCSMETARVLVQLNPRPCNSPLASIAQALTAEGQSGAT